MDIQKFLTKITTILVLITKFTYWYAEALFRKIFLPNMKSINGETILITGAVGGIGKEICKHLVRSGSKLKLVLWDLNQTDLEKFAAELRALGRDKELQVYPMAVDISTRENIDRNAEQIKNEIGSISIIFNNAGIAPVSNFIRMPNETIEKIIQVNLMSHFWIIRQFLPDMATKNHGRIVNIASAGALRPSIFSFPYFSSKYAVNGYTESLKLELAMYKYDGIHVSTVYPYYTRTPLVRSLKIEESSEVPFPVSLQQFMSPADVGKQIVDGMRREYEYIYCPDSVRILQVIDLIFPLKFRKLLETAHCRSYAFESAEDKDEYNDYITYNGYGGAKKMS